MDRLFYVLLLTAAVFVSACTINVNAKEDVQPVFFSMLFPQLVPEFAQEVRNEADGMPEKAVKL